MRAWLAPLLLAVACGPSGGSTSAPEPVPAEPPSAAPPVDPPTETQPPTEPSPSPVVADSPDSWRPPLPPLSLGETTDADKERARACMESHRVQEPDVTAAELLAAARCMGEIPLPGHEIRLYRHLVQTHPDAAEVAEALREQGLRFEQIDVLPQALDSYELYLQRYPKHADARGLGQRAVCLARALKLEQREAELLAILERMYGRRGFESPTPEVLARVCEEPVVGTP